jgi:hypothetical protein
MTTSIPFERWELEYLTDCIAADHESTDVQQLRNRLMTARDMLREHEAALAVAKGE